MWRDYSISYIKKNKASSISIMVAALVASLFLSLICSLFYNMWKDNISRIIYEEGDWQGRITGEVSNADVGVIENFANVTKVVIGVSGEGSQIVDVYFRSMRAVYNDLPEIASRIGVPETAISYHETLLAEYMVFNPQDEQPPLLLAFYLLVMVIAGASLILIIHNAFAVSMGARIHQLGILSSVGATPGQIKMCLLQEAAALCSLPILVGSVGGIGLCFGVAQFANSIASKYQGNPATFYYHPLVWGITMVASCLTVFLSAWLPARKMSRMTPLEAIRTVTEQQLKRRRHSRILSAFFGMEGELAGNALKSRKKALRTSSISLTLSFLAFTMFLCFITLSGISTRHTYFERYKDAWDVMITMNNTSLAEVSELPRISEIDGVGSLVAYQKVSAYTLISDGQLAAELKSRGGLLEVEGSSVQRAGDDWIVKAPVIILDDSGFQEYCEQIGIEQEIGTEQQVGTEQQIGTEPQAIGRILINRIWDNVNSDFKNKEYIPFLEENMQALPLTDEGGNEILGEIPVLGYATELPVLREEYDNFSLIQVLPESAWLRIAGDVNHIGPDTYLRILASEDAKIYSIEAEAVRILAGKYEIEPENRIQKEISNTEIRKGYMLLVGALCGLLALIGIANIFSNTLGFLYQRKREFARYLSVGVTPGGIRRILWIEAFTIAGRPLLLTLPLTVGFVLFAVKASYLPLSEFMAELPVIPVIAFILVIVLSVGLAYYIGGKRLLYSNLSDALKNDAML